MGKIDLRKEQLLFELNSRERINVQEIQELLNVSASTARRLCISLESDGRAVRILGGIKKLPDASNGDKPDYSYDQSATANVEEKRRIGQYASSLVRTGDIIYVTGGTTVYAFVLDLRERIRAGALHGVVIMTNSLANAEALSDTTRVLLTGGEFRPKRRDLAGYLSEQNIRSAHFNKCFAGVDGIDLVDGLMALDMDTANMDQTVTAQSDETFILTDHTKFRNQSFIIYERISARHTLITDDGLDPSLARQARDSGIKLITV